VGFPLSTTHVMAGGVMGAGAGKRISAVRWGVAGNMAVAWLLTLPAAAGVGAATYAVTTIFGGGVLGPAIVAAVAIVPLVLTLMARARQLQTRPAGGDA
jgi:PiT family inorganic phosphate transporter